MSSNQLSRSALKHFFKLKPKPDKRQAVKCTALYALKYLMIIFTECNCMDHIIARSDSNVA